MVFFIIILFLVFYIPYKLITSVGNYFVDKTFITEDKKSIIHYHTHITNNIENKTISIIDPDTKEEIKKTISNISKK